MIIRRVHLLDHRYLHANFRDIRSTFGAGVVLFLVRLTCHFLVWLAVDGLTRVTRLYLTLLFYHLHLHLPVLTPRLPIKFNYSPNFHTWHFSLIFPTSCWLEHALGQADLAHVCLVSHHLRSVAEPLLYYEVSLSTVNTDRPLFELFLSTILRRPILAGHVHFLSLMWYLTVKIIPLSRASLDPLSGTFVLQPQFAPPPPLHGGYIQRVLCLLPRLEVVELAPAGDLDIFSELLNHADGTRLQHLREVRYISGHVTRCMSNKTLIALLMLPSIRRIDVRLGADEELPAAAVSAWKSAVTDLRFISPISPVTLVRVLEYSRALTHFTYERITVETINSQQIGQALGSNVRTLQYIALNIPRNVGANGPPITRDHGTCFNLGTLREWLVLWFVKSPLRLLLGRGGL